MHQHKGLGVLSTIGLIIGVMVLSPVSGLRAQEMGAESFVEIHGYVDMTYMDFGFESDPVLPFTDGSADSDFKGDPTFDNNHMAFFFGADVSQNIRFASEFHFEHAYKELEMPAATITWSLSEPLVLTFGRSWLPFGTLGKDRIYTPTNLLISYPYTISMVLPFHYADNGDLGGRSIWFACEIYCADQHTPVDIRQQPRMVFV